MKQDHSILIAGCGYVGSALAEKLTLLGWNVDGIRRTKTTAAANKSFNLINLDMTQEFQLSKSYSYVFYLASAGAYDAHHYDQAYRLGMVNLLNALSSHSKPKLLVFASSTSVYAQHNGEWVDEDSPISTEGFARKALLSGENLALESDIPAVIVRFSGIYGPGRMRFKEEVLSQKRGIEQQTFFTNRIHQDDCVGAMIHLINNGKPGEIYLISDNEPADHNDVVAWICQQGQVDAIQNVSMGNPSFHRGNKRCSNKKLLETGYQFVHPHFRSGYRST